MVIQGNDDWKLASNGKTAAGENLSENGILLQKVNLNENVNINFQHIENKENYIILLLQQN